MGWNCNLTNFLLCLATLSSIPNAFGSALPHSEIEIFNETYAQHPPNRIRITSREGVSSVYTRVDHNNDGSNILSRGNACCRCGVIDDAEENPPILIIGGLDPYVEDLNLREPAELTARGIRGIDLVANPPPPNPEWDDILKTNYEISKLTGAMLNGFEGIVRSAPYMRFFKQYKFDIKKGWETWRVMSTGNPDSAVAALSIGSSNVDGKEYVAIVAHGRFARYDANRYIIDVGGFNVIDDDDNFEPNLDPDARFIPVSQLVYFAMKMSGKLDLNAEKYFFVSEQIINDECRRDQRTAKEQLEDPSGHAALILMKNGAEGPEGEMFKLLCGNDNTYSYLNTIGRNPQTFAEYELVSLESRVTPYTLVVEIKKKPAPATAA